MSLTARSAAVLAILSLAACEKPAGTDAPSSARAPDRADAQPVEIAYACEGGKALRVRHPDARTAVVTYEGQTFTLTLAESASGQRFTGAGREWWVKSYPDREEGTLSPMGAAAGGAPIAVCSKGPANDAAAGPAFNPSEPPKTSEIDPAAPTDPNTSSPITLASAPPCRSGDLSLRRVSEEAGAGQRQVTYAFVNNARAACSLKGFPTLTWYDENGKALAGVKVIQSEAAMFETSGPPTEVMLAPGGRAVFYISFSAVQSGKKACPVGARLQATPPENSQILELDDRIQPCTGQVRVGPVRSEQATGTTSL